ncbi:hypothetical protein [Campylobacter concisus]|uniref:hypothetical protein n=1 Tax=Campylobacter concisus TaxID=199 RepID=UPI001F5581A7|nr:hypothetical protein [Campylobacter concisus]
MSNLATKPKFALAALIGLVAGVVSAFVKWGAEVPLPLKTTWICLRKCRQSGRCDRLLEKFSKSPYVFFQMLLFTSL